MQTLHSSKTLWKKASPPEREKVSTLADALGIDTKLASILIQRGIENFEEARSFFRPDIMALHDPFLMKDMDKAVNRIQHALDKNERIMVYGDYDVDGTTAVALVYAYLKPFFGEARIMHYVPDRYSEGYGISFKGIDIAKEFSCSLIIALDCGIRSLDKVDYARTLGIDFIICDHHLPGALLPEAVAVLDPKRADCEYPYKELSGCGIGFKLVQALNERWQAEVSCLHLLDLVATSIAADIVPITGENRILAYYGLSQINSNPRPGLKALLKPSKELDASNNSVRKHEITISDLVFTAAPRINAAGRIDHGTKAVELLLTEDEHSANNAVFDIHQHNSTRRSLDQQITAEALQILENAGESHSNVLYMPHWHKGVVGIVASRVIERYYKPTIVLTESNGSITGSARSVRNFDVHEAIAACGDILVQYGGHKYAAGLTLKPENLDAFRQRFEEEVARRILPEHKVPVIEIDAELEPDEITPKFYRILKQLAPFGPGNMLPVFACKGVKDDGSVRIVGTNHLKMKLGKETGASFDAIGFNMSQYHTHISLGLPFDVCYTLEENHFNGHTTLQWVVKDICV
jgi:single-stranded-DNA-specific exonuclease